MTPLSFLPDSNRACDLTRALLTLASSVVSREPSCCIGNDGNGSASRCQRRPLCCRNGTSWGDRPSIPSGDPTSSVNFLLTLSEPLNRETVGRVASQFVAAKCSTVTETLTWAFDGEPPMRFLTMSNAHPQIYGHIYSKVAELLSILRSH
jgi:hypothetical protein